MRQTDAAEQEIDRKPREPTPFRDVSYTIEAGGAVHRLSNPVRCF